MSIWRGAHARPARVRSRSSRPRSTLTAIRIFPRRRPGQSLTVGWIGIPLNAHYLTIVEPALRRWQGAAFSLDVVGAPVPEALAGIPAESFPWTEDSEIAADRGLRCRHHAAARHAVGTRQMRL